MLFSSKQSLHTSIQYKPDESFCKVKSLLNNGNTFPHLSHIILFSVYIILYTSFLEVITLKNCPYIAIPPGETLLEIKSNRNLSIDTLSSMINMSPENLNKLIKGELEITTNIANQLEKVLGIPKSFWINLETNYRTTLKQIEIYNSQH